jgi:hypothetical protein
MSQWPDRDFSKENGQQVSEKVINIINHQGKCKLKSLGDITLH